MTTTTSKGATKSVVSSTSTALVSLAKAKAKVTKPSKVVRKNAITSRELTSIHKHDVNAIALQSRSDKSMQMVANLGHKVLQHMDYATYRESQAIMKADHVKVMQANAKADGREVRGDDEYKGSVDNWWSKLVKLGMKKCPSSPSDKAQAMQAKRKGAKQVKGAPKKVDNRVTPLSTKLQEIKTQMLKRDMYSVKAGTMLNLLIAECLTCEKVEKAVK